MRTATIDAPTKDKAIAICQKSHGFTPDAIRQVDSGGKAKSWLCFESTADADAWDKQR